MVMYFAFLATTGNVRAPLGRTARGRVLKTLDFAFYVSFFAEVFIYKFV